MSPINWPFLQYRGLFEELNRVLGEIFPGALTGKWGAAGDSEVGGGVPTCPHPQQVSAR